MKMYIGIAARQDGQCPPIAYKTTYKTALEAMSGVAQEEYKDLEWYRGDVPDEWIAKSENEIYVINSVEIKEG